MKLLLVSLTVMALIAMCSVLGLGTGDVNEGKMYFNYNSYVNEQGDGYIYDESGHVVTDFDLNPMGESGEFVPYHRAGQFLDLAMWRNSTGDYFVFWDSDLATVDTAVTFDSLVEGWSISDQTQYDDYSGTTFLTSGSIGVLALIGVIMGIGAVAGLRFFGSGESEISVKLLLLSTFFVSIWLLLTAITYPLFFNSGQILMYAMYFILSLCYATGLIMQFSGGSE